MGITVSVVTLKCAEGDFLTETEGRGAGSGTEPVGKEGVHRTQQYTPYDRNSTTATQPLPSSVALTGSVLWDLFSYYMVTECPLRHRKAGKARQSLRAFIVFCFVRS